MKKPSLFGPNSHSNFKISWKPVSNDEKKVIKNVLLEHYEISKLEKVSQIDAWEIRSSNFRVIHKNRSGLSSVLLRKNIQHSTSEALIAIDKITEAVAEAGLPTSRTVPGKDGAVFADDSGVLWQLFKFIKGQYYRGTKEELKKAAAAIASLHKVLSSLSLYARTESSDWVLPIIRDFEPFFKKARSQPGKLNAAVVKNQELLTSRVKILANNSSVIKNSGTQIIHADLHPHNFLFHKGKLSAVLDFGDIRSGFRAADVASACHRLVRQYVVFSGRPWQDVLKEGLRVFLNQYQSIYPLPKEEFGLLPYFMELALLRKVKGNLSKYYQKKPEWSEQIAYEEFIKQKNLLAEVDAVKEIWLSQNYTK